MKRLISLFCFFKWFTILNGQYTYEEKYFNVQLDHFAFDNNKTFPLCYLINDQYWTSPMDGPIMFYPGNELSIENFAEATGFLWEAAKKFKALVCFCEHRFYGKSIPFGNSSFDKIEHFGYLTIEQALADFIDLIYYLKNDYKKDKCGSNSTNRVNPVIVMGGSYGGELATYMRIKYPAAVQGALASSGVLLLFLEGRTPCNGYSHGVTEAFAASSKKCVANIKKSWKILRDTMANDKGKEYISKSWKLCNSVKTNGDIDSIAYYLGTLYGYLAMGNYPYETNFLGPMAAHPVDIMCKELDKDFSSDKDLLTGLFNAVSTYVNHTKKVKCYNMISGNPDADIGLNIGGTGWSIQGCTEMPVPFCSKGGDSDMFERSDFDLKEYIDGCYASFNLTPNFDFIRREFGLDDLRYLTNIIISKGDLDPWGFGALTKADAPLATIVSLEGAAHHLDLRATNPADPPSVTQARIQYQKLFRTWIEDFRRFKAVPKNEYDTYLDSLKF